MNKFSLMTKQIARFFSGLQTRSDRCKFGAETVRGGPGANWEGAWGLCGLEIWGSGQDFWNTCWCGWF